MFVFCLLLNKIKPNFGGRQAANRRWAQLVQRALRFGIAAVIFAEATILQCKNEMNQSLSRHCEQAVGGSRGRVRGLIEAHRRQSRTEFIAGLN
jgi:hypothetical protein